MFRRWRGVESMNGSWDQKISERVVLSELTRSTLSTLNQAEEEREGSHLTWHHSERHQSTSHKRKSVYNSSSPQPQPSTPTNHHRNHVHMAINTISPLILKQFKLSPSAADVTVVTTVHAHHGYISQLVTVLPWARARASARNEPAVGGLHTWSLLLAAHPQRLPAQCLPVVRAEPAAMIENLGRVRMGRQKWWFARWLVGGGRVWVWGCLRYGVLGGNGRGQWSQCCLGGLGRGVKWCNGCGWCCGCCCRCGVWEKKKITPLVDWICGLWKDRMEDDYTHARINRNWKRYCWELTLYYQVSILMAVRQSVSTIRGQRRQGSQENFIFNMTWYTRYTSVMTRWKKENTMQKKKSSGKVGERGQWCWKLHITWCLPQHSHWGELRLLYW